MDYFSNYASDCTMGSGNQSVFYPEDPNRTYICRAYYRLTFGGEHCYSLLYSNIVDSTFADGSFSHRNQVIDSWKIHGCRIGLCEEVDISNAVEPSEFLEVMFSGSKGKTVFPGEFFCTDPVLLKAKEGEYLCVELEFSGKELPCHPESWLPGFVKSGEKWEYTPYIPFASMVGSDRPVKHRLVFMGDSITQGIGTEKNSYQHVAAQIARVLGPDTAVWNIALGYGRANDAATDGAWLYKAKQSDVIVICYGVNDLQHVQAGSLLEDDLLTISHILKKNRTKVLIETIPPFDFEGKQKMMWEKVNSFIRRELVGEVDDVFDVVPVLGNDQNPTKPKYGGHPNEYGNTIWADSLLPYVIKLMEI